MNKIIKSMTALLAVGIVQSAFAAHWNYTGTTGPADWGSLHSAYKICQSGLEQSPIDITQTKPAVDAHFSVHYRAVPFNLRQTTHNLYADSLKPLKNYVVYDGQKYSLQEIHFHVPSEHALNGKHYPMEAHFVHKDSKGELLVLGMFLTEGASNKYFSSLFSSSAFAVLEEEIVNPVSLNPADLVSKVKNYYVYSGSLTTPPCVEGVTWIIAKTPATLSAQQLQNFKVEVSEFNARPLQPLRTRKPECQGC